MYSIDYYIYSCSVIINDLHFSVHIILFQNSKTVQEMTTNNKYTNKAGVFHRTYLLITYREEVHVLPIVRTGSPPPRAEGTSW